MQDQIRTLVVSRIRIRQIILDPDRSGSARLTGCTIRMSYNSDLDPSCLADPDPPYYFGSGQIWIRKNLQYIQYVQLGCLIIRTWILVVSQIRIRQIILDPDRSGSARLTV